jgi:hypothetical protein
VAPLWQFQDLGVAVREVRWRQLLRLGESEWDGTGIVPTEVWLGFAPAVGGWTHAPLDLSVHEDP